MLDLSLTALSRAGRSLPVAALALMAALASRPALATPLYAAREGRTCDNCHLTPNGWENPSVKDRKCTLSCQGCHVDPTGGGMRNTVGRFFGRSTLPMIATSPRPTQDWDREIAPPFYRRDKATTYSDSLPLGPATFAASRDAAWAPHDFWGRGYPLGGPSRLAPFPGRMGALNSDPMLRVGWDMRLGLLAGSGALAFPMQADLEAALHPVEHFTVMGSVGARGHSTGWSDTFDDPSTPYLRHAFVLVHELPGLAYVKAGRFVPSFGLRIDDHTAQNRRAFEFDGSLPESRVTGVEAGLNPNYPYARVALFQSARRGRAPDAFDIFDHDPGHGLAIDAGYRELGWSVGGSLLQQRRDQAEGGDASSVALTASLNPWFWSKKLPLTWQAEYDLGDYRRESGLKAKRRAFYQELDWLAGNGVNFLVAQDWADPDLEVKDDQALRFSFGAQVTPIPGITVDGRIRTLMPAGDQSGADFFLQLHFWN